MSIVKLLKNAKPDGAVLVTNQQEVVIETMKKELNFCEKDGGHGSRPAGKHEWAGVSLL